MMYLTIFIISGLLGYILATTGTNEVCIDEPFHAECSKGEVIIMMQATYGFMGIGRCVPVDLGINCTIDALPYLNDLCSMKQKCSLRIGDLDKVAPCLSHIRPYLLAGYRCIPVETSEQCSSLPSLALTGTSGFISSSVAREKGCGTISKPWTIKLHFGQKALLEFADFMNHGNSDIEHCTSVGFVVNHVTKENVSICHPGTLSQPIYIADGQDISIQMLTSLNSDYILEYTVTGCVDLLTPEFAWYERSQDEAVIGCKNRNMTWHLHCEGNRWNGVMGKCHDKEIMSTPQTTHISQPDSYQFLILVCIIAAVFITLLVCITVAIFKLIDRRNAKQLAKQQILLDSSTSHRYSGGPQRHDPLMYHERIEMVPDILENSLRRTYAPGKADSESSSQTNYPGTLYFMGTLGHNVQSPVVEAIPLPRKPASVSDSESEHLYDSIPADCT